MVPWYTQIFTMQYPITADQAMRGQTMSDEGRALAGRGRGSGMVRYVMTICNPSFGQPEVKVDTVWSELLDEAVEAWARGCRGCRVAEA